jgi:hypothetical protein
MRKAQNEAARLQARELQDRQWVSPMPDVTAMPRLSDSNRVRLEWETRDTMSNRLWTHTVDAGPTQVTAAALAAHPTGGAEPFIPSTARQDQRHWSPTGGDGYFPSHVDSLTRPELPPKSLFQNAWADGFDTEGGGAARELRSAVREDNRHRFEDTSARLAGRTFEHQWIPPTVTRQIVNQQIDAAVRLRPTADDYWRPPPGTQ